MLYEAFFGIVEQVVGGRNGRKFFPVIFTIFIFLLLGNWFGLFPWNNVIGQVENVREHYLHELEVSVEEVREELAQGERAIAARRDRRDQSRIHERLFSTRSTSASTTTTTPTS